MRYAAWPARFAASSFSARRYSFGNTFTNSYRAACQLARMALAVSDPV